KGKELAKSEGTFTKYEHTVEKFLDSLGERAKRNVNQVTPRDIQRFRDAELHAGKHPRTCNYVVKHLRTAFNVARRQAVTPTNPADAGELLDVDSEATRRPFDFEQVKAILKAAPGDWRGATMVAFYTGARLQDVTNLRWGSIDLANKWISFRAGKTRQRIKIPIHDALHNFLLELSAPDNAAVFVFPSLAGKRVGGKSGLSMAFKRIMERAKVSGEVVRERSGKAGRTVNSLSFHSFRHSLTSIMA